jgi:hypothetical protein
MKIDRHHGLARFLKIVNPATGLEIPHVTAVDTERGELSAYVTTTCAPGPGNGMLTEPPKAD